MGDHLVGCSSYTTPEFPAWNSIGMLRLRSIKSLTLESILKLLCKQWLRRLTSGHNQGCTKFFLSGIQRFSQRICLMKRGIVIIKKCDKKADIKWFRFWFCEIHYIRHKTDHLPSYTIHKTFNSQAWINCLIKRTFTSQYIQIKHFYAHLICL